MRLDDAERAYRQILEMLQVQSATIHVESAALRDLPTALQGQLTGLEDQPAFLDRLIALQNQLHMATLYHHLGNIARLRSLLMPWQQWQTPMVILAKMVQAPDRRQVI